MNKDVAEISQAYQVEAAEQGVPVGYKQTEVGVIPEDWMLVSLGERASFIGSGKTNTKLFGSYVLYGSTGVIGSCPIAEYEGEAILVARVGANAGTLNFVSGQYGVSDNTIITKLKADNNIHYIKYWLIRKNLNTLVFGSGQPLITGTQLKQLLLPLPSKQEQTAIANALSDVDALLSELEKLIAKKQAIKTATMQQLLTGRTRLPQFALHQDGSAKGYKQSELGEIPEDWDIVSVGECVVFVGSGKTSTKYIGEYPLYGSTGIIGSCSSPEYEGEAVLVARVGANAGKLNFVSGQYGVSDNTIIVKFRSEVDIHFFRYWLIRKNLNTLVFGSGQPLITGTQIKDLSLGLPTQIEQTAIATIFSDMDAEIQALEHRLNKTHQIKQGMMQELLTGRTRLL